MSKTQEEVPAILTGYVTRAERIKQLESELSELKHQQSDDAPAILTMFQERGTNSFKTPGGTVYLQREVVVRPHVSYQAACAALRREGLERFTDVRIVNEKELSRYIDQHGLAPKFEDELDVVELFHVRVRRNPRHV